MRPISRRYIIIGGLLFAFIILQFIGNLIPGFSRTNPPVTFQMRWANTTTDNMMRIACYDCHSNETRWPLYSKIAPISWLIASDVNRGREELNFSTGNSNLEGTELIESIIDGEMPPTIYTFLHPDAKLNDEEQTQLINGIAATFNMRPIESRNNTEGDD